MPRCGFSFYGMGDKAWEKMSTAIDLDVEQVKRLYADGNSTIKIGELLGCSYQTVNRRLKASGVDVHKRSLAELNAEEVLALYENGMSARQIDMKFGWGRCTTAKFLRKIGRNPGKNGKYSEMAIRRICPGCGVEFMTHNPDKLFCTKLCCARNRGTRKTDKRRMRHSRAYKKDIPLRKLYERDGGTCYLCGCATDFDDYTVNPDGYAVLGMTYPTRDHVVPLANGGEHTWENVKLACFRCNSLKGAKPLDEFEVTTDA